AVRGRPPASPSAKERPGCEPGLPELPQARLRGGGQAAGPPPPRPRAWGVAFATMSEMTARDARRRARSRAVTGRGYGFGFGGFFAPAAAAVTTMSCPTRS